MEDNLSITRQCELMGIPRSSYYYRPRPESELNLELMRLIDEQYTKTPFYGIPRMTAFLKSKGYKVNHKRVERLMGIMGIQAIYPKKRCSVSDSSHRNMKWTPKEVLMERCHGFRIKIMKMQQVNYGTTSRF